MGSPRNSWKVVRRRPSATRTHNTTLPRPQRPPPSEEDIRAHTERARAVNASARLVITERDDRTRHHGPHRRISPSTAYTRKRVRRRRRSKIRSRTRSNKHGQQIRGKSKPRRSKSRAHSRRHSRSKQNCRQRGQRGRRRSRSRQGCKTSAQLRRDRSTTK